MSAKQSAIVSLVGLVLMGFLIFSADEAPSSTLRFIQYIAVAACLIGLVGALLKISRGEG